MRKYVIKDLERLSGVKAHTIRIWETRYGLLNPERTTTNIRKYSDDDLKKLLNVTMLLERGFKISKIGKLDDQEIRVEVARLIEDTAHFEDKVEFYIQAMVVTMLELDEAGFTYLINKATKEKGFVNAILELVYPFLMKVGLMWGVSEVSPAQEHFISCLIRQKLLAAIDNIATQPTRTDKKFVLFLPANELHEIGLILANYLIRTEGYEVVYLGQNVPSADLEQIVRVAQPTHVLTIFTASKTPEELSELLTQYDGFLQHTHVLYSGLGGVLPELSWSPKTNTTLLNSAADLIRFLA